MNPKNLVLIPNFIRFTFMNCLKDINLKGLEVANSDVYCLTITQMELYLTDKAFSINPSFLFDLRN